MDGGTWRGLFTNYELRITNYDLENSASNARDDAERRRSGILKRCGVVGRMRWDAASCTMNQGG